MLNSLYHPTIRDGREARSFVIRITVSIVCFTLGIEVLNQILFFEGWSLLIRECVVTIIEASGLTVPLTLGIARTHLELYNARQVSERASLTDPLTGLLNRRGLAQREASLNGATLVLAIADIDRFKRINDTHGHLAGDRIIEGVGRMLSHELAEFGSLARVGGEEFALLSAEAPSDVIRNRLDAARRRIEETAIVVNGFAVHVTISAGLATGGPEHRFDQLYADADQALYAAKMSGRNRVLSFEPSFERQATRQIDAA